MPFSAQNVQMPTGFGGQTLPDWISALQRLITPAEVEARVVGDPRGEQLVANIAEDTGDVEGVSSITAALYKAIAQATREHKQDLTINTTESAMENLGYGLSQDTEKPYTVYLRPSLVEKGAEEVKNQVTAHELLHFLLTHEGIPAADGKQHDIMKYLGLRNVAVRPPMQEPFYTTPTKENSAMLSALLRIFNTPQLMQYINTTFTKKSSAMPPHFPTLTPIE